MAASTNPYVAKARQIAVAAGVPAGIFLSQINAESGFNPNAASPAGAQGIAQIVPKWHPGVNTHDPIASLQAAAQMDAQNYKKYGNWNDVLSVYNSGRPWAVGQTFGETKNYVAKILAGAQNWGGSATPVGRMAAVASASGALPSAAPSGSSQSDLTRQALMANLIGQQNAHLSNTAYTGPSTFQLLASLQAAQPQETQPPALSVSASQTADGALPGGTPIATPNLKWLGNTAGVKQSLLKSVSAAARAAGATQIKVTSGYRDPGHNSTVGGVQHSNHLTGDALDGYGLVKGRWVPLGQLLLKSAGKFGLRSGDVPGFFNGGTDPVHVDDGANQR